MKKIWFSAPMLVMALLPGLSTAARADDSASIREIVRVVKSAAPGDANFTGARIGTPLPAGARVRTAGRSRAGLRFPDRSLLRIDELSEVVITDPNHRGASVTRGQVFLNFHGPGTITGGYAAAAVRGTHVEYAALKDRADVRCYEGRVYVASIDNPVVAGTTSSVTPVTLTDTALTGSKVDWAGAQIQFVDGPYVGQKRAVSGFDADTGVVTFAPALGPPPVAPAAAAVTGYLLVKQPQRTVVELGPNMGTTVLAGRDPMPPYHVPGEKFAGVNRQPFFRNMYDGEVLSAYPGTIDHQIAEDQEYGTRVAIGGLSKVPPPAPPPSGGKQPPPGPHALSAPGADSAASAETAASGSGSGSDSLSVATGAVSDPNLDPNQSSRLDPKYLRTILEPFAVGADDGEAAGIRAREQAVLGSTFLEVGYLYRWLDSDSSQNQREVGPITPGRATTAAIHSQGDISEALFDFRGPGGDLTIGRQHLFLGPANNSRVGSLLGLEAVDAVVYETPPARGLSQQLGYVENNQAPGDERRWEGGFARGQAPLGPGLVGYSLKDPDGTRSHGVGWSLDGTEPLLPNLIDVYGEGGADARGRRVETAGLYFPALYQKARLDAFLEYARGQGEGERSTFRLQRRLGNGFMLVGFVDQPSGQPLTGGGGIAWSVAWK